jgi:hypothetical protein
VPQQALRTHDDQRRRKRRTICRRSR